MKCYYINDPVAGKVLIPGCMAVAVSNDIEDCTCTTNTFYAFEKERFNEILKQKDAEIKELNAEIKRLNRRLK